MKPRDFNTDGLKVAGVVCMVFDHVGAIIRVDAEWMRLVGRFAFPMFALAVAVNFLRTRCAMRYAGRLAIWGLVAQPLFWLSGWAWLNVMFTLAGGVVLLHWREVRSFAGDGQWRREEKLLIAGLLACAWVEQAIGRPCCDFGLAGIVCVYALNRSFAGGWGWHVVAVLSLCIGNGPLPSMYWLWACVGSVAAAIVAGLMPRMERWPGVVWYAVYPGHLAVLLAVKGAMHG